MLRIALVLLALASVLAGQAGNKPGDVLFASFLSGPSPVNEENIKYLYGVYVAEYGLKSAFAHLFKNASTTEHRMKIFEENIKKIKNYNNYEKKLLGMNMFTGLSFEEFKEFYLLKNEAPGVMEMMKAKRVSSSIRLFELIDEPAISQLQTEFDWRLKNKVTGVKDQGLCGSCYAFSSVAAIEAHWAIKTGTLNELSEQQIVDCSYFSFGCKGGYLSHSYLDVMLMGGLNLRKNYPYAGVQNEFCLFNKTEIAAEVPGGPVFIEGVYEMMAFVSIVGPISVGYESTANFQFYSGDEVFFDPTCTKETVNHAVTIIGYGTQNGVDYWLVKNSWGPLWGNQGFGKIRRGTNECNIEILASSPDVYGTIKRGRNRFGPNV